MNKFISHYRPLNYLKGYIITFKSEIVYIKNLENQVNAEKRFIAYVKVGWILHKKATASHVILLS